MGLLPDILVCLATLLLESISMRFLGMIVVWNAASLRMPCVPCPATAHNHVGSKVLTNLLSCCTTFAHV